MDGKFEHLSESGAQSLDGKKLPVTIEVNGEKQVIGEATFRVVDDGVHFTASIQKGFEGLVKPNMRHFSIVNSDPRDGF